MGLAGRYFAGDIANAACFTLVFPQGHLYSSEKSNTCKRYELRMGILGVGTFVSKYCFN